MNVHSDSLAVSSDYRLFGLHIRSELDLPELPLADERGGPDVTIRIGKIPPIPMEDGEGPHSVEGGLVLAIRGIAGFFIKDGAEIIVEPGPDTSEGNVRLFLLGSVMGALLHQRGLLPLHANAVEIDGKAVAFMGESGAGKSTLAAWFHDRGHRIIADDVCVVRFDEAGRAKASPGLPRLRLWKEALEATGREASSHARSYAGSRHVEKYDVPVASHAITPEETDLAAVYLLGRADEFSIEQMRGVQAADTVFANTYRGQYLSATDSMREYWQSCVRLVQGTPVFSAKRSWGLTLLDDQSEQMLEHARQLISAISRVKSAR